MSLCYPEIRGSSLLAYLFYSSSFSERNSLSRMVTIVKQAMTKAACTLEADTSIPSTNETVVIIPTAINTPGISNVPKGVNSQPGTPPGATRRKHPQQIRKPHGSGVAEVTKGRWSGWRLAAIVVAFPLRMAFFARGRKNKTIHIKHNHALCTRLA